MNRPEAPRLADYRAAVHLDQQFRPSAAAASAAQLPGIARALARQLQRQGGAMTYLARDADLDRMDDATVRGLLRAMLTVRGPGPLPAAVLDPLDALLAGEQRQSIAVDSSTLPSVAETLPGTAYAAADRTALWLGDITTLVSDSLVNAANSGLLGCFQPLHACIDNAIHSVAGPRLREDCHAIMSLQGQPESTGTAKITRGYHLPAGHVLHTVGPIVEGPLRPLHERQLAAAYRACLDLAAEAGGIQTLAFCAISTGVFGYPKAEAARVALRTVADWLAENPGVLDRVVFTVFSDEDNAVYLEALSEGPELS